MVTECFISYDLPEKFIEEIKRRLVRLDSPRAGSIFPQTFEDGMRLVYLRILGEDGMKREKEIIETYNELTSMKHKEFHLMQDLRNKHYHKHLENIGVHEEIE